MRAGKGAGAVRKGKTANHTGGKEPPQNVGNKKNKYSLLGRLMSRSGAAGRREKR